MGVTTYYSVGGEILGERSVLYARATLQLSPLGVRLNKTRSRMVTSICLCVISTSIGLAQNPTELLIRSIRERKHEKCETLLKNGAIPIEWIGGTNAIEAAIDSGDSRLIQAVVNLCAKKWKNIALLTAFQYALSSDKSKVIKVLSSVNTWDGTQFLGFPPLSYAITKRALKSVSFLAATQNNFTKDSRGGTALHLAVSAGPAFLRKIAITVNSINAQDKYGCTPLHYAVQHRLDSVKYLLDHGANPNIRDNLGKTPLDYVVDSSIERLLGSASKFGIGTDLIIQGGTGKVLAWV